LNSTDITFFPLLLLFLILTPSYRDPGGSELGPGGSDWHGAQRITELGAPSTADGGSAIPQKKAARLRAAPRARQTPWAQLTPGRQSLTPRRQCCPFCIDASQGMKRDLLPGGQVLRAIGHVALVGYLVLGGEAGHLSG
jgi:hypothetical protein